MNINPMSAYQDNRAEIAEALTEAVNRGTIDGWFYDTDTTRLDRWHLMWDTSHKMFTKREVLAYILGMQAAETVSIPQRPTPEGEA